MSIIIEFEGIDGSGKSTCSKELSKRLSDEGHKTKIISSQSKPHTNSIIEFLRANTPLTIEQICAISSLNDWGIQKWLDEPGIIILDRYIYTSIAAYRTFRKDTAWANALYKEFRKPDLVILTDLCAQEALRRKSGRITPYEIGSPIIYHDSQFNGFLDFQTAMRNTYLEIAKENRTFFVVDNTRSVDTTIAKIMLAAKTTLRNTGI